MTTIRRTFMPNTVTIPLIDIRNLSAFSGRLSPRVMGLVIEWATLHQQELLADWERAQAQQELKKIPPIE